MYLKVIEMKGFKSFAEKTRIELNQDFTAIVGPNGSGKSNITEAIKWVLGEQSAKSLRGERMDDVIFAGTESKQRAPYAEVSLEFDNSDQTLAIDQELVRITRRLTRGGDSNYMINGRNCRLKDITDLMLDTGIGRHSFSAISQGRVEEIFNQRAEDRREIFEEAAGVMKYKSRRKDAGRKLERAMDNQHRLDDIIQEIEGRLEPLKEQRDDAVRYRELTDELRAIDIQVLIKEIDTATEDRQAHEDNLKKISTALEEKQQTHQSLQRILQEKQHEKSEAEASQEALHNKTVTLVEQIEKLQADKKLAEQQHAFDQQTRQEQEQRLEELHATSEKLRSSRETVENAIASSKKTVDDLNKQKKVLDEKIGALEAEATEDVESLRNQYFDYLQEQNQLKNQINALEQERALRKQRTSTRQKRLAEVEKNKAELSESYDKYQQKENSEQQSLNEAILEYNDHKQVFEQIRKECDDLAAQLEKVENAIIRSKTTRDSLKNLSDSYEGFYNGVKNALKWGETHAGVAGAVAELIRVPQEYTRAVEEAVGGQMQNIVVENGDVAQNAIVHLKSSAGGRATFLPLDKVHGRQLPPQIVNEAKQVSGVVGRLSDLVQYDAYLEPIVQYLMGNILVTDTISTARRVNGQLRRGVRIVTLDGDIVNAGGALTGGRNRHNPQHELLVRNQKIAEENKRLSALTQKQEKLHSELDHQRTILSTNDEKLREEETKVAEKRQEVAALRATGERLAKQLKDVDDQLKAEQYDNATDSDDDQATTEQLTEYQERIKAIGGDIKELRVKIENFDQYAKTRQEKLTELNTRRQSITTELAIQKEKLTQKKERYSELNEEWQSAKRNYDALTHELDAHREQADDYENDQAERAELLKNKQAAREQMVEEQQTIKQKLEKLHQQLSDLDSQLAELNKQITDLQEKKVVCESDLSREDDRIDGYLTHLSEDYTLTYERAKATVSPLTSGVAEAKERMKRLRTAITQLGAVNLQAIEEYDQVSERHEFMTKQRADVLEAVNNLKEAIQSLDNEVKTKFSESFHAIRDSFEAIFPKLFNGGKATLELTDPDDLLNTGVEIMAQPPGKQLQLMSLLSGGERSLTAIALLFAIIAVNPVPFSILDEVEAALDDANVDRYGQYLQQYAEQTQFIVITHRKGTMVHANVLYGVTMEEAGVSKLAAVKLTDIEE